MQQGMIGSVQQQQTSSSAGLQLHMDGVSVVGSESGLGSIASPE